MAQEKKIIKWIQMAGLWDISNENPVYLKPQEVNRPYGQTIGICTSGVPFQEGSAKVTVCFSKAPNGGVDPNASGGVLFGFQSVNDEYFFATAGGFGYAYAIGRFKSKMVSGVGSPPPAAGNT